MLRSLEKPFGACSLAVSSKYSVSHAFYVLVSPFSDSWVIDSRAMDHMTNFTLIFDYYTPCPSNKKISIANGSLTIVASQGKIHINSSLASENVLHIPKFSTNLVSIHHTTKDMNFCVVFYTSYCVFWDNALGKMIGLAKEKTGSTILMY